MKYPFIASRVFNTPLLIHPQKLNAIANFMRARMMEDDDYTEPERQDRSIYAEQNLIIVNDVAQIGMQGILVNRKGQMEGMSSELISYHLIRENLQSALNQGVRYVVLDVDSPGGEAIGAYECAEYIYSLRNQMEITACISGMCCSAAYFLASAANKVVIAPTSYAGHVGIRYRRWDFTKAIANQDIAYEDFYRGDAKLEGDHGVVITEDERSHINAEIDMHYQLFTQSVAKYRNLTQQAVIDTQAQTYYAKDAVAIGFADEVMDVHDAVGLIYEKSRKPSMVNTMQTTPQQGQTLSAPPSAMTTPSIDIGAIKTEAATQERARISAILTADEAKGRETLAQHFAFSTAMQPSDAIAALKVAPVAMAEASSESVLNKLMAKTGSPEVSSSLGGDNQTISAQEQAYQAWAKARGYK